MERYTSAEELDFLTFFEVEPHRLDPSGPWPYDDSAYQVMRGDMELSFAVMPAHRDVRIVLKRASTIVYELNALSVEDVRYVNELGRERLEVQLGPRELLTIRVKPTIHIDHRVGSET